MHRKAFNVQNNKPNKLTTLEELQKLLFRILQWSKIAVLISQTVQLQQQQQRPFNGL